MNLINYKNLTELTEKRKFSLFMIIFIFILFTDIGYSQAQLKVLNYLYRISGKYTVAGQQAMQYRDSLYAITRHYPGLWGEDFSFYPAQGTSSLSQWRSLVVTKAKEMWAKGDIIALMFHACPPTTSEPCNWNGDVLSHLTDAQWDSLITDGTQLNKNWKARLGAIVPYLKDLQNSGVEVLFRPLHEMNQGAFWWGGRPGPNGTAKLYQITHDYLVKTNGITNLIWVWSLQDFSTLYSDVNTYDPGSKYWDVLSLDVYEGDGFTFSKYNIIADKAAGKPIAIAECGVLPAASTLAYQPLWTYFMGWAELTQQDNSNAAISSLYNASNVITEDKMPGWKGYWAYSGTPYPIPGKIEAENFDKGGEGVSYHDTDTTNTGGQYRTNEGVDIETCSEGGYDVTDIHKGEWLNYAVKVDTSGIYNLQVRVSSVVDGRTFHIELDSVNISGAIEVPNTGGSQTWTTVSITTPLLTPGIKIMQIVMDADSFNLDYVKFTISDRVPSVAITSPANRERFTMPANIKITSTATDDGSISKVEYYENNTKLGESSTSPYTYNWTNVPKGNYVLSAIATDNTGLTATSDTVNINVHEPETPYDTIPYPVPGKIEAENYDNGGEGVGYHDLTVGNMFNVYRHDDVDIGICTDTMGGYAVGYFQSGEWLQYTVNVTKTQDYDIEFRVAAESPPIASISLDLDGKDVTGPITVNTGGAQNWESIVKTNIPMTAGQRILRLNSVSSYPNINYINITASTAAGVDKSLSKVPKKFQLSQNYPNPFNPTTTIKYEIPKSSYVTIKIYDSIGREVKTLVHEEKSAGYYSVNFDGKDLSSGVYFYTLKAENYYQVKQMILLK